MRLTVLGGCGGWPAAGLACSGYLVEHEGFRLLIDPGYAILPRLLTVADRMQEQGASSEAITLKISTPEMILEGIRRIEAWSRIARGVGGLGARYLRADGYERVVRGMTLPPEKTALLDLLATPLEVEAICAASTLPDFEICRTLWAFRVTGIATRLDAEEARPRAVEDEGLGDVLDGDEG